MSPDSALTHEEVAAALRRTGRRVTAPRLLVYHLLQESGGHATAERLMSMAARRGERVTLPSVYAALTTLVDLGLARIAYVMPGGAVTYDARAGRHHHLVCRLCGRIEDVDCGEASGPCLDPPERGDFAVEQAEVTFVGLCSACAGRDGERD